MSNKINHLYEFDGFRVDPHQKCLWHGDDLVSLTPKAFETLIVLVENKGKIVDKETLLNQVWANTFVEEATLAQNISTLRKIFTGKQFIETIPRRGYRFIEEVREVFEDEEVYLVETLTRTHISAQQTIEQNEKAFLQTGGKKRLFWSIGILATVSLALASFFTFKFSDFSKSSFAEKFEKTHIQKLTSNGNIHRATISPDGKYLALIEKKNETSRILLQQTNNSNQVEIVSPTLNDFIGATFSPDSQFLFYSIYEPLDSDSKIKIGVLYKIPILGGIKTEVLRDIDSPVAVSSDGNKFAFIRQIPSEKQSALILFEKIAGESGEKKIGWRSFPERFSVEGLSFAPDGKYLAVSCLNPRFPDNPFQLLTINTEDGETKALTSNGWLWMGRTVWLKDNSGIVFTAYKKDSPNFTDEIWFASFPKGELKKITNGINGILGISADDSKSIVGVISNRISSLVIIDTDKPDSIITLNKSFGDNSLVNLGIDWTSDGKIFYANSQGSNSDIWMVDEDGTKSRQLTIEDTAEFNPVATNNGKYLVFISNQSDRQSLQRLNMDGTNKQTLAQFPEISSPGISPDGQTIYFSARRGEDSPTLWKISIAGGEPIQITNLQTIFPQISDDGKFIFCFYPKISDQGNSSAKLMIPTLLTLPDGKIYRQFENTRIRPESLFQWIPNENAGSFLTSEGGVANIWKMPIDQGQPQKLLTFVSDEIFRYRWSKNGKRIVLEKGQKSNEVIKISE